MVELCTSRVLAMSLLLFGVPSLLSCAAGPLFLEVPGVPVPSLLSAARSAVRPEAINNFSKMKHVCILGTCSFCRR